MTEEEDEVGEAIVVTIEEEEEKEGRGGDSDDRNAEVVFVVLLETFEEMDDTIYGVSAECATATGWSLKYLMASERNTAETKKQSISRWITIRVVGSVLL